jgi:hypothetical protein
VRLVQAENVQYGLDDDVEVAERDGSHEMELIGTVKGAGNGYDDPGSVHINVTDEWEIELVVKGRDGGSIARVFLGVDPGVDSVFALALHALQAERRVGEWAAAAQVLDIARRLGVTLGGNHTN